MSYSSKLSSERALSITSKHTERLANYFFFPSDENCCLYQGTEKNVLELVICPFDTGQQYTSLD